MTALESNKLTDVILDGDFDIFQWGWYVEPDPDSMLSYFTCDQRGGWSDSWYCNPEYDALYTEQNAEMDQAEARAEIVKQMQQILYEDSPYLVRPTPRSARPSAATGSPCFQPQPDPGGICCSSTARTTTTTAPAGRPRPATATA